MTLYNTGVLAQKLDLSRYFRLPSRSDVQRQALVSHPLIKALQDILSKMSITEQEVKPIVTPVTTPGPGNTIDPIPSDGDSKPYVTPVAAPDSPNQWDQIPPQEPPQPYVTPVSDGQQGSTYNAMDSQGNEQAISSWMAAAGAAASSEVGTSEPNSILIGEGMPGRVIPVAQQIGSGTYNPPTAPKSEWLVNDKIWMQRQIDERKIIYDIGVTPEKRVPARSPYYQIERQALINAGYQQKYVKDVSFSLPDGKQYIVKLYQWSPQ